MPITIEVMNSNSTHDEVYSIKRYVIKKIVNDKSLSTGQCFLRVLPVSSTNKTDSRYNWNIVESGVKHHKTKPKTEIFCKCRLFWIHWDQDRKIYLMKLRIIVHFMKIKIIDQIVSTSNRLYIPEKQKYRYQIAERDKSSSIWNLHLYIQKTLKYNRITFL